MFTENIVDIFLWDSPRRFAAGGKMERINAMEEPASALKSGQELRD